MERGSESNEADRAIEASLKAKDPIELREAAERLGTLLREGPPDLRGALADRLLAILEEDRAGEGKRSALHAMWQLYESLNVLPEPKREAFADRVLVMAQDLGMPGDEWEVLEMPVLEALRALCDHVPSRRDAILDFLFGVTANGIYDLRCLALHALVEVAGSLSPDHFGDLIDRAAEMARSPNESARGAGRSALDMLSESGPEDWRNLARARRKEVAQTLEALLDMPLRELATSFASVPDGEREALYDRLVDRSHDFVWSTYHPISYEPSLDKHPREYEEDEQALLSRLFAVAPDSRRPAALERLFACLFGPMDMDVRTALERIVGILPPSIAEDILNEWPPFGALLDALQRADAAVVASLKNQLRESCRTLLEMGPKETGLALVLGAGMIIFLDDHDDVPLARQLLEGAIRRCESGGAVDPWDTRNQGILHGARLFLEQVLWEIDKTEAAK